ncbi:hypothetical protein Plhal304r1_c082g0166991 [Plasmopara halstedii]
MVISTQIFFSTTIRLTIQNLAHLCRIKECSNNRDFDRSITNLRNNKRVEGQSVANYDLIVLASL